MLDGSELTKKITAPNSYYLEIPDNDGDLAKLRQWMERGHQYWRNPNNVVRFSDSSVTRLFNTLSEPWENLLSQTRTLSEEIEKNNEKTAKIIVEDINTLLNEISKGLSASADSPLLRLLDNPLLDGPARWGAIISAFNAFSSVEFSIPNAFRAAEAKVGFLFGLRVADLSLGSEKSTSTIDITQLTQHAVRLESASREAKTRIADIETAADNFNKERIAACQKVDERVLSIINNRSSKYRAEYQSHKAEMERIRRTYKDLLALKDAAAHWRSRATRSQLWAGLSLVMFLVVAGVALWILFDKGPALFERFLTISKSYEIEPSPLLFLAFVSVPSAILIWAVRFPSKLFSEHVRNSNDASFRQILITTYLSLLRDESSPVKVQERHFALQTIFSALDKPASDDQANINFHEIIARKTE